MSKTKSLDFNTCLITGGAGGLGKVMAEDLIKRGKKVLIAGRTASKLEKTVKEIGAAGYYELDTGKAETIAPFVEKLLKEHPDLDCVINNAGVQKPFHVLGQEYDFDLTQADQEIDINIRGPMHLCVELVKRQFGPRGKEGKGSVIMNVSSVLGFVPFSNVNPVYNGTKAWLHFFTMNLRTQLEKSPAETGGPHVKVIEIIPPTVETDLHRDRKDPDDNKKASGNKGALSVEEFIEHVGKAWENNDDEIAPGMAGEIVAGWQKEGGERYNKMGK